LEIAETCRMTANSDAREQMFDEISRVIEVSQLRPTVDQVFSFNHAQRAHRYLAGDAHFGQICIAIRDPIRAGALNDGR
jgi:NADPH:quinone reductase-like Zn-dependent oxidoreductase